MDTPVVQRAWVRDDALGILAKLGVDAAALSGGELAARSPVTGERIAALRPAGR